MSGDQRPERRPRAERARPAPAPQPAGNAGGGSQPTSARTRAQAIPGGEDDGDTPERRARQEAWRGLDQGSVMSVELITATLVWFGIGWLLDRLLGTEPWLMFAGALLGNWAGLYLIWVRGQRNEAAEVARRKRAAAPAAAVAATPGTSSPPAPPAQPPETGAEAASDQPARQEAAPEPRTVTGLPSPPARALGGRGADERTKDTAR